MATTRLAVHNIHQENNDAAVGKAALGKTMVTRSALSTISNTTQAQQQKGLKEQTNKPSRVPLGKAKAGQVQNKENGKKAEVKSKAAVKERPVAVKARSKAASPAPMDISANSQCMAFSSMQITDALPKNVQNIDCEDADNPQLVCEYVNGIYDYMRELEQKYPVKVNFLSGYEITGRMRSILIDWLVQVHMRFHLLQETLYLTVAILDRFLQVQRVERSKLQLVGVTSMLIASKYEEMYAPEINDFEYITDNAYSNADIRRMECCILRALDFNLGRPLPLHFLRRNSKAGEVDATRHTLAKYLMELAILEYDIAHYPPSQVAASALCLAMRVLGEGDWDETLTYYSKYSEEEMLPIMRKMAYLVAKAGTGKLTAIHLKYQSSKFMRISGVPELKGQTIVELAAENDK